MSDFKFWNGSAFVTPSALKRWNGSAFVDISSAHIWDGSQFVKVWPSFTPTLVSVTTVGAFSVPWLAGATKCDVVLCGGGGGGGGGKNVGFGESGGSTTCTTGTSMSAAGAPGGANDIDGVFDGEDRASLTFNTRTYPGGVGGDSPASFPRPGQNGTSPGAGGGGGWATSGRHGGGGSAGSWASETITHASVSGAPLAGSVGAGGAGGDSRSTNYDSSGGKGGDGAAYFWFYT